MISESRYLCARVFPEDRFGAAPEPVYCDEHHATPAQARKHAKTSGYTHIVRHTVIGIIEPASGFQPKGFRVEEDDFSVFVPIGEPYRTAIPKLAYVPRERESNEDAS